MTTRLTLSVACLTLALSAFAGPAARAAVQFVPAPRPQPVRVPIHAAPARPVQLPGHSAGPSAPIILPYPSADAPDSAAQADDGGDGGQSAGDSQGGSDDGGSQDDGN